MNAQDFSNLKIFNPDRVVCYCKQVTQKEIEKAIQQGSKTMEDIRQATGACTGNQCKELNPSGKCCSGDINRLLNKDGFGLITSNCCG
ncbi:MAG: (2Fe-2S)-binding protein [Methylococcaceae bacterium]|nr:(2Fe-2S)-binding protein [Prolixibacteraceae bacterium]